MCQDGRSCTYRREAARRQICCRNDVRRGRDGCRRSLRSALSGVAYDFQSDGTACPAIRLISKADRSEEHTSELQSLMRIAYAVFCLKKKTFPVLYFTKAKRSVTTALHE